MRGENLEISPQTRAPQRPVLGFSYKRDRRPAQDRPGHQRWYAPPGYECKASKPTQILKIVEENSTGQQLSSQHGEPRAAQDDIWEGTTRKISLDDVDAKAFEQILHLWSGKEGHTEQLEDVMVMASVADRLEMLDVLAVLEAAIIGELRPELCAEVLMSSRRLGLGKVEEAAWGMAVRRFDEVCRTAGFMGLDEETVGKLLEEDGLGVVKEEEAFEGLVGWMKGNAGGGPRGRELLGSIRFGVMEERYLEEQARGMLPEEHREWMEGLVGEALRAQAAERAKAIVDVGQLGAKALTRRRGRGVDWGRYCQGGGGRRLQGHSGTVFAFVEWDGRMCSA